MIDVSVLDENLLEDNETVTVTLTASRRATPTSRWAAPSATRSRSSDDDTAVSLSRPTTTAAEPADDGQFTVTLSNPSDTDTVVSYTVTGDATAGSDYTALTGTVTITAGSTTATIDVAVT